MLDYASLENNKDQNSSSNQISAVIKKSIMNNRNSDNASSHQIPAVIKKSNISKKNSAITDFYSANNRLINAKKGHNMYPFCLNASIVSVPKYDDTRNPEYAEASIAGYHKFWKNNKLVVITEESKK